MPNPPELTTCPIAALRLPDTLPECLLTPPAEAAARAVRYGQIMPIVLRREREGDGLALGGIVEFLALKAAGARTLLCRIAPEAPEPCFALRLLSDRELYERSPIAQGWIAWAMRAALDAEAMAALLPLLGLTPRQAEERIGLLRLPPTVQAALHEGVLSPKNAALARRLPEADQTALADLVRRYALGGSKQRQALELFVELCLREETNVAALLALWRASGPPTDNAPQEAQHLLRWLETRANPGPHAAEVRFQEQLRALKPPPNCRITHTPSFEDDAVSVQLHFPDWPALKHHWPELLKLLERGNPER